MLNIIKLKVLNKKDNINRSNTIKSLKHYPSSIREWNNSIYVYNENSLNLIHHTMVVAINIIRSYFSLYNYNIERKIRTKRLNRRIRRLSLNKIYVSNGEFKHTNNKVIINLYLYNRQKYNYISIINKLILKHKKIIKIVNNNKYKNNITHHNKYKNNMLNFLKKNISKTIKLKNEKYEKNSLEVIKSHYHKIIKNKLKKIKIKNIYVNSFYKDNLNTIKHKNLIYKFFMLCFQGKNNMTKAKELYNADFNKSKLEYKIYKAIKKPIIHVYGLKFKLNKLVTETKTVRCLSKQKNILYFIYFLKCYLEINSLFLNAKKLKPQLKTNKKIYKINKKRDLKIKHISIKKKGLFLLKLINKDKYLVVNNLIKKNNMHLYISSYIINFYKKLIHSLYLKLKLHIYYKQIIYINSYKFKYNYLQYLSKYLSSLYNKNIEYNLINLKYFYMHSDTLSESITLKLTRNRRRFINKLKRLKKKLERKIGIYKAFAIKKMNEKNQIKNHSILNYKNLPVISKKLKIKKIIKNIKHKHITGFRLEAKGRLTRRYTAARSMSKNKYEGSLSNLSSSYKGLSCVLLKGNLKSSLQYTKLKSKTRIGSFGIKGWMSGN